MTDAPTPPDWVLIEAAKRGGWGANLTTLRHSYGCNPIYVALCDMILKHEQEPVDRKLLCAREASLTADPDCRVNSIEEACVRAIELYESGFGK